MKTTRSTFLASVAAVALLAGPALAQTLQAPPSNVERSAPPPAAQQNAPAERIAPPGPVAPDRGAQRGAPETKRDGATTGQSQPKQDAAPKGGAQTQASPPAARNADDPKAGAKPGDRASDKPAAQGSRSAAPAGTETKTDAQTRGTADTKAGASVQLNTEQRTKVRTSVLKASGAPRVTNVNFSISVGTVVPKTVRVVAVPPTLVEIQPSWRGYMYFIHGDEIVIVEPGTLRIVAVLVV